MALDPGVYYVRDNSTGTAQDSLAAVLGSVGWSAMTAWAPGASIAPGTLRRQSAGAFVGTASRSGTTLTVTAVTSGTIYLGMELTTAANTNRCTVTALGTGTGGTGTYTVSVSGTVGSTTWNGFFIQGNQLAFIATQSATGTTGATEPNWSNGQTRGVTFTDNTVTWVECTGLPGVNNDFTNTPNWTTVKGTVPLRGTVIKDNAGTHLFIQTSAAGAAGSGAEPSWNVAAVGNTTVDNTITWTYIGTSFGAWAAPLATVTQAAAWVTSTATGHIFYVGDDHNEQYGNSQTIAPANTSHTNPAQFLSVDHTSTSRPPVAADLKIGATASALGTFAIGVSASNAYWYGWTFDSGIGSSNVVTPIIAGSSVYDGCTFKISTTNNSTRMAFGGNNYRVFLNNCSMYFSNASQQFELDCGEVVWRNSTILASGSTVPTTLIYGAIGTGENLFEGCDFTGITGTLVPAGTTGGFPARFTFVDCTFDASLTTIAATPVDLMWPVTDVVRCSSDTKTYIQRHYLSQGTLSEETTVVRTGGAAEGATGISWKLATTGTVYYWTPFEAFPIAIYNSTTGSNVIVTLYGIWNSASLPNNDDIWVDVEYLGNATTPLGKYKFGSKTNILASGTPQAADSVSAWDSVATARAQNHAYSIGDIISASNNAGRIFFCTVAGTSANTTLPAGYASVVDGGTITDGGATFRAGMRFTLTVTLTSPAPQLAGYLQATVRAAKLSSTFYVDPLIALS